MILGKHQLHVVCTYCVKKTTFLKVLALWKFSAYISFQIKTSLLTCFRSFHELYGREASSKSMNIRWISQHPEFSTMFEEIVVLCTKFSNQNVSTLTLWRMLVDKQAQNCRNVEDEWDMKTSIARKLALLTGKVSNFGHFNDYLKPLLQA